MVKATAARSAVLALALGLLVVGATVQAKAQSTLIDPTTLQIVCTGATVCSPGTVTLVTSTKIPTFTLGAGSGSNGLPDHRTGSLFLVVLIPGASSLSFTANGTSAVFSSSWSGSPANIFTGNSNHHPTAGLLPVKMGSTTNQTFSSFESASAQSGLTSTQLTVEVFNLGAYTGHNTVNVSLVISSGGTAFPAGTVFYSFLTSCSPTSGTCNSLTGQTAVNSTPLASSLTTLSVVPEPGSAALYGMALIALASLLARGERREN